MINQPQHTYIRHHHQHTMTQIHRNNTPNSGYPNRRGQREIMPQDPRRDNSGSNATIMDEHDRFGSNPMTTETTAKDAPTIFTLNIDAGNSQLQDSRQAMNGDGTIEASNDTELLCTRVTLLLKVLASNNTRNTTQKIVQDFLVQIQQSYWNVAFLSGYT